MRPATVVEGHILASTSSDKEGVPRAVSRRSRSPDLQPVEIGIPVLLVLQYVTCTCKPTAHVFSRRTSSAGLVVVLLARVMPRVAVIVVEVELPAVIEKELVLIERRTRVRPHLQ